MKLRSLTAAAASELSVSFLGLDSGLVELASQEGLAASLRRAASFMCPTSPSRLIDAVLDVVRPLVSEGGVARDGLADLLSFLIADGDLLELRNETEGSVRLLYLGPPSYIEREPGTYLLLGVRPFGAPLVDAGLRDGIEAEAHTRIIRLEPEFADERLVAADLQRIEREYWVASPRAEEAAAVVGNIRKRLEAAGASGDIENLLILDPTTPVRYYRGRWRSVKPGDKGDFVARRPQAYGADLWCMVRLVDGNSTKMIEFPVDDPVIPGRDEAWRVQMALDSLRGSPQQYAMEPFTSGEAAVVKFFSPVPGFAERYLQLVGLALAESPGALFAFRVPDGAMCDLRHLLADRLWMEPMVKRGTS
jgi:hypothetical protein